VLGINALRSKEHAGEPGSRAEAVSR